MNEPRRSCLILLAALLSGLASGNEPTSKYVCQSDKVQLFQNITFASGNTVNLYLNGQSETLVSTWHSVQNRFILERYKEKVTLDEYGNIWILNIQLSENGTYLLQYNTDIIKSEVEVYVMDAPTNYCKPKIEKAENILIASIQIEDCGRPLAQVHWLEYPDISYIRKDIIKLPPEKEVGTYYACVDSPALKCVKSLNISSYCTGFTVQGKVPNKEEVEIGNDKDNSPPVSSAISHLTTVVVVVVSLVSIIAFVACISGFVIILRRINKCLTMKSAEEIISDPKTNNVKDETQQLLKGKEANKLTLNEQTTSC